MYFGPLDEELETHELIISLYELENNSENMKPTDYLFYKTSLKANKLGLERRKIKSIEYSQDNDGNWTIKFGCEIQYI